MHISQLRNLWILCASVLLPVAPVTPVVPIPPKSRAAPSPLWPLGISSARMYAKNKIIKNISRTGWKNGQSEVLRRWNFMCNKLFGFVRTCKDGVGGHLQTREIGRIGTGRCIVLDSVADATVRQSYERQILMPASQRRKSPSAKWWPHCST